MEPLRFAQLALVASLSLLAMAQFALSQERHWNAVRGGQAGGQAQLLRRGGAMVLLLASLAVAIWRDGPAFGSLVWFLVIQCAAFGVTGVLSFSPRLLRFVAGR